jgi:hypothetical protein
LKFEGESLGCPFLGKLPNLSKEYMSQKYNVQINQSEKKYLSIAESAKYLGVHHMSPSDQLLLPKKGLKQGNTLAPRGRGVA